MRIAITGGAGFVGWHLTTQLRAMGHDVTHLARSFAIESEFDALIHAAWDFADPEVNVGGSMRLFDAAKAAGIPRIVFISSLSAFEGCRSRYGATKLTVEKAVAAIDGCTARLGFVCDDSTRGLSGALKRLAALPVIPLPGGGRQNLYTIRAEDLGDAFVKILNRCGGKPLNLAHPEPISLAGILRAFARQQGKRAVFLPLPWRILWAPLRAAESIGLKPKFRSDSLVSLMNQNPAPDFRGLAEYGIAVRAFREGNLK